MKLNEDGNLVLNNPIKIGKAINHCVEEYDSIIVTSIINICTIIKK